MEDFPKDPKTAGLPHARSSGMKAISRFVCLSMLAVYCGACGGGKSPQAVGGSSPPLVDGYTLHVTARGEIEPNNSLAEADAHTMPAHGVDADYVGFGVIGTVNDTADPADYFVFAASRAHVFTIQMCPSINYNNLPCVPFNTDDIIDTSVAYFEVQDHIGVLLLSSQGDIAAGNFQEVSIDAGVAYYVAVFAEDTVGATQSYYIKTAEKAPFP